MIDTSTSQPGSTLRIAADLKPKGVRFVDAPLTRTPVEAEQGRLNTMVGADHATFEEIEPVLKAFCENIFHVGDVGAGHKIKLINNCAAIGQMALIAEALTACAKLGVDPKKYFQLVSPGAANSGIFQMLAGQAIEGDFKGMKFGLANAAKDVRYYTQTGDGERYIRPDGGRDDADAAGGDQSRLRHARSTWCLRWSRRRRRSMASHSRRKSEASEGVKELKSLHSP